MLLKIQVMLLTYTAPNNGDMALIYADRQVDIDRWKWECNMMMLTENRIVAILIYEGGQLDYNIKFKISRIHMAVNEAWCICSNAEGRIYYCWSGIIQLR